MSRNRSKTVPPVWIVVYTGNSGLTHYSFCLARALREAGTDVTLVTNTNYELDFMPAGFPVIKVFGRTRFYPLQLLKFLRLYLSRRPGIVHYQAPLKFPAVELLLLELQKMTGARLIHTAHDWLPHDARIHHQRLFGLYYRLFDRIIVHSRSGARFMADRLGIKPERVAVIPHGDYGFFDTDPSLSSEGARERLGLDPGRFWFLFFGHIAPYKGLDLALDALARAAVIRAEGAPAAGAPAAGHGEAGPAADEREHLHRELGLLVAGDPEAPGMGPYEQQIEKLGLAGSVSIHTGHIPVDEVQVYLKAADALVLPYRESSTSGIVHLAMGFVKPVVASDVGGLSETVTAGAAGILVPPSDAEALAAAMLRLAEDPQERRRLEEQRRGAATQFSWESIAERTIAVYRSAAE